MKIPQIAALPGMSPLGLPMATIERLAPSGSRATKGTRDVIDAAIAAGEGRQ